MPVFSGARYRHSPRVFGVELGSSGTSASCRSLDMMGYVPNAGPYWQEFLRTVDADTVHPLSDTMMARISGNLRLALGNTGVNGMPFNCVSGTQPWLPITASRYDPPGQVTAPLFAGQSQENWYSATPPTQPQVTGTGDHHVLTYVRDESTGLPAYLCEVYQAYSNDGGANWGGSNNNIWDLAAGTPCLDGSAASNAAGTPILPFLLRRDEVERGAILHPLVCAIPSSSLIGRYVWPARAYGGLAGSYRTVVLAAPAATGATSLSCQPLRPGLNPVAYLSGSTFTFTNGVTATLTASVLSGATSLPVQPLSASIPAGHGADAVFAIPYGARLRLKSSWYAANYGSSPPAVRIVLDALQTYGFIVTDAATPGMWLSGVADNRWTSAELAALAAIPTSAFEVIQWRPEFTVSGPTTGPAGSPAVFVVDQAIPEKTQFSQNVYFYWTQDNIPTAHTIGVSPCNDTSRGPFTFTFTPASPGVYLLYPHYYEYWMEPPVVAYTAT